MSQEEATPNQSSRQEALRRYTRDNGWFLCEEDQLGPR
jgi:predicted amidohydrolase YtcJ